MTRKIFNRVMNFRRRDELWTKASFLEDEDNRKSQREAVRLMRMAIKMGGRETLGSLAYAYDIGSGLRPSRRMALHLWGKNWRAGSANAAKNIAITLRVEGRASSAIHWFRIAITAGDPDARLHLAKLLLEQLGDREEARHLLEEFVAAGPQQVFLVMPGQKAVPTDDDDFLEGKRLLRQLEDEELA